MSCLGAEPAHAGIHLGPSSQGHPGPPRAAQWLMVTEGHAVDDLHAVPTGWHATTLVSLRPARIALSYLVAAMRKIPEIHGIQCNIVYRTLTARSDEDEDEDKDEDKDEAQSRTHCDLMRHGVKPC